MDLHQRLENIRHEFEHGDTPREIIDILNDHIDNLVASNAAEQAIKVGAIAPTKLRILYRAELVPLSSLSGKSFLVLTWFRGNW